MARCDRCAAILYRASSLDIDRWLALTIAAAIVFVIANVYPVVRISLQGLHDEATLWQSAAALSIIVVPFLLRNTKAKGHAAAGTLHETVRRYADDGG